MAVSRSRRSATSRFGSVVRAVALALPTLLVLSWGATRALLAYPGPVNRSTPVAAPSVISTTSVPSGSFSVSSETGAAQYSFPISMPVGRRGLTPRVELVYSYDSQHQLISAASADGTSYSADFVYSPAGRILAVTMESLRPDAEVLARDVWYDYDGLPGTPPADPEAVRVLRDATTDADIADFTYDDSGNLVQKTVDGITWRFRYDGDDELREACLLPDGACEVYYYDHDGQRMLAFRTAFGADPPRGRQWFGETEIEYRDVGGALEPDRTLVHASLGAMPVARIVAGDVDNPELTYSGVLSHLLAVLDAGGTPVARYAYSPFGELLWQEGGASDDFHRLFNGKELDELSELSYYGFRYYDRLSLQWTQRDPLYAFAPDIAYGEPRRMGLYTFVLNNPLRYIDPDGRGHSDMTLDAIAAQQEQREEAARQQEIEERREWLRENCRGGNPSSDCPGKTEQDMVCMGRHGSCMPDNFEEELAAIRGEVAEQVFKGIEYASYLAGGAGIVRAFVKKVAGKVSRKVGGEVAEEVGEKAARGGPTVGSAGGPGAGKRFPNSVKDAAEGQAGGRCVFCETKTTRTRGPTQRNIDHAIPKSRGGNNTLGNAQNTCRTCNPRKGAKTTVEYLQQIFGGGQ